MTALRTAVLLMVLGNLLLFAYGQGYLGAAASRGEPERFANQIEPEKLRIVTNDVPPAAAEPPRDECRALGALPRELAQRLVELLGAREPQLKLSARTLDEPSTWWVLIPPQPSKQQADRKAAELKALGVEEFFIVQESGPSRNAVSLGLFKSEQGARDYLELLYTKGVRSAKVQTRGSASDRMAVEARGSAQRLTKALSELPAEFAAAAPLDCVSAK